MMSNIIISSRRLCKIIMNSKAPRWTWARFPNSSLFFYSYDTCERLGNHVLRHKIENWNHKGEDKCPL